MESGEASVEGAAVKFMECFVHRHKMCTEVFCFVLFFSFREHIQDGLRC